MSYHVLVLAGGSGTRLWPLSRSAIPKHLLPLGPGGTSLLRATVERVLPLAGSVRVVTASTQADLCRRALDGLDLLGDPIIAEPQARGTGPALGLAVRTILDDDPAAVISSVHADAHIGDSAAYQAAVLAAAGWASATDGLATVGLTPTYPATGFGYIRIAAAPAAAWGPPQGSAADANVLSAAAELPARRATGFAEKPVLEVATAYLRDGGYLWNTGLFAWPGRRFWSELTAADPGLGAALGDVVAARRAGDEPAAAATYAGLATQAVEPLIFERTPQLTVVRADFAWSDLGTFADLHGSRQAEGDADADGNVLAGDVVAIDVHDSLISAAEGRTVAVVGLSNIVALDAGDAVLVLPRDASQRVKEVVDRLRAQGRISLL